MKSKKKLMILGAALVVVVTGGLLVAGGTSSAGLGSLVNRVVAMIAYPNRSADAEPSAVEPASVQLVATRASAKRAASNASTGAAESDDVEAAPEEALLASGIAAMSGQIPAGLESDPDLPPPGVDGEAAPTPLGEEHDPVAAAAVSVPMQLDASTAPVETPQSEHADASLLDSDGESGDDWNDSEVFRFEDEEILRQVGPAYQSFGSRDPFYALVTSRNQDAPSSSTVDPDRLRLVGIVWGGHGTCALVEDDLKRGYVLREGDRVLYGRVASISRDSVIINQVIYGEFKRVKLQLKKNREGD